MHKIKILLSIGIILVIESIFLVINLPNIRSSTVDSSQTNAEFSVIPIFTNLTSQQSNLQYFKLKVAPNKSYSLPIAINNLGPDRAYYEVSLTVAASNNKGIIDYASPSKVIKKNSLVDLSTGSNNQEVSVSSGNQKIVKFKIKIPRAGFAGTIAGGIYVKKKLSTIDKQNSAQRPLTLNQFAETVPVLLSENFEKPAKAKLTFGKISVFNAKRRITKLRLILNNASPTLFGNISLTAKIYKIRLFSKQLVLSRHYTNYQIAPFAPLSFILISKYPLERGNYQLTLNVKSGKFKQAFNNQYKIVKYSKNYQLIKRNSLLSWRCLLLYTIGLFIILISLRWWK